VGGVLFGALRMLGVEDILTPLPDCAPYPGENVFRASIGSRSPAGQP
jgi:hypothetical protein